jgi:hypothetical protein
LRDAYLELNSKRMFWIVLILSAIVMGAFGVIGVTPFGLSFAGYEWDTPFVPPKSQYKLLFSYMMIDWWLTWAVLILALISTAGIFPDFLSGGSIDLFISKPISRLRLFLTKYFTGMLFAFLQVSVFAVAAFFIVGWRGKIWEPRLFMAIPIVLALFSYLYGISVLLGVLTRSTIATLLLTILFWAIIGGMHYSETRLQAFKNIYNRRIETIDRQLAEMDSAPPTTEPTTQAATSSIPIPQVRGFARFLGIRPAPPRTTNRDRLVERKESTLRDLNFFGFWTRLAYPIHVILPKTSETADMLDRELMTSDEYLELLEGKRDEIQQRFRRQVSEQDIFYVNDEVELIRRARSKKVTILSSLGFEFVVVGLAAWVFCRRDF